MRHKAPCEQSAYSGAWRIISSTPSQIDHKVSKESKAVGRGGGGGGGYLSRSSE